MQYLAEEEQSLLILHNVRYLFNFSLQFFDCIRWFDLRKFIVLKVVTREDSEYHTTMVIFV